MADRTIYKTATTRKPTGMSIDQNEMEFTAHWKVMDENHDGGQIAWWHTNVEPSEKWYDLPVTSSDTSVTVAPAATSYYPYTDKTLRWLSVIVKGRRGQSTETDYSGNDQITTITTYRDSDWERLNYYIYPPNVPTAEEDLDDAYPRCVFSWDVETESDDHRPFTNVEWQSMRIKNCSETDGSKLRWASIDSGSNWNDWRSGGGGASGSITISEDSTDVTNNSLTRWVRFRSRGPGGASAWRYIKHVYATPYASTIDRSKKKTYATRGENTFVRVEWTAPADPAHPIDETLVQYLIDTPAEGMTVPDSASWTTAVTIVDSTWSDAAQFTIDGGPGTDQCLWVRTVNVHDVNRTECQAALLLCSSLAEPEFTGTIEVNTAQCSATISATNNSDVPDSQLAVYFYNGNNTPYICAIIPHGSSTVANVQLTYFTDAAKIAFGLKAFQGAYKTKSAKYTINGGSVTYYQYTLSANMESAIVKGDGDVPVPPTGVTLQYQAGAGAAASQSNDQDDTTEVLVNWNWNWKNATAAEVSWSRNPHAWESTDAPETYTVDRVRDSQIWVGGLARGARWYFRVRFLDVSEDATVYGPYSTAKSVLLADTPSVPVIRAPSPATTVQDPAVISGVSYKVGPSGLVQIGWSYINTDGTTQGSAKVREVTYETSEELETPWITKGGDEIETLDGEQILFRPAAVPAPIPVRTVAMIDGPETSVVIQPSRFRWAAGSTHYLQVRVASSAGLYSGWSDPIAIRVAEAVSCTIAATSLTRESEKHYLTALPLTVTVQGAGAGDTTSLVIERAEDYTIIRPDETDYHGCEGETIVTMSHRGADGFTVSVDDLIGALDDQAKYRIIATVEDDFGQTKSAKLPFWVRWAHQPMRPSGSVVMDGYSAIITPTPPAGATVEDGDVVDIYRLSADKPELIVKSGAWGNSYRDPYPAIGEPGGHRVVYRSSNGDYFDADSRVTWIDLGSADGDRLDSKNTIIDFGRHQIELEYNLDLSSNWEKDFVETTYLGGSVQGDWNPAVRRNSTVTSVAVPMTDTDQIADLRRLAVYPGICHVRTPDGSSFAADIQVSESRSYKDGGKLAGFTLAVTRVDPETLDGETVEEG